MSSAAHWLSENAASARAALNHFKQTSPSRATELVFDVETITPALLGGYDSRTADAHHPIREKALRGHLREWWRVLAAAGDLDGLCHDPDGAYGTLAGNSDLQKHLESLVWGSIGAASEGRAWVSTEIEPVTEATFVTYQWRQADALGSSKQRVRTHPDLASLKFALFAAGFQQNDRSVPSRSLLNAGYRFRLKVSLRHDWLAAAVLRVIQLWGGFGGVGSRTRRGLGAVSVACVNPERSVQDRCSFFVPSVDTRLEARFDIAGLRYLWVVFRDGHQTPTSVLATGLRMLNDYLQLPGLARAEGGERPGRSMWPEADLLRQHTGTHFCNPSDPFHEHQPRHGTKQVAPRIAFGHRKLEFVKEQTSQKGDQEGKDPSRRDLVPEGGATRLRSSLLIRPLQISGPGGPVVACLFAQVCAQGGANLPKVTFLPQAGNMQPVAPWLPGLDCGPLGLAESQGPIFVPPQDAAQAFMNWVCSVHMKEVGA